MPNVKTQPALGIRKERALVTRRRMLAAAYELFCESGYAPVTMAAIAERAGVAVQTLHFTFHTKAELLAEVVRVYSSGADDPIPVMDRPWVRESLATPDPRRQLALTIEHGTEIYVRMAPLTRAIQSAASVDADVAELWDQTAIGRRAGMRRMVDGLAAKGGLAPGLTAERATDLIFVLQSHETFLGLTAGCGWTVPEYKAWQYRNLCLQILGDSSPGRLLKAAEGLSFQELLKAASA